jgi:hypothetical protein
LPGFLAARPEFRKACPNSGEGVRKSGKLATISGKPSGTPESLPQLRGGFPDDAESSLRFGGSFPYHIESLLQFGRGVMMIMKACCGSGQGVMMTMKACSKFQQDFMIKNTSLFKISWLYGSGRFKRPDP